MFIGFERKTGLLLVVTVLSGSASFVSESISVSIITDEVSSLPGASQPSASSIAACNLPDITINSELKPDMFPLRLYDFTLYV